MENLKYNEKKRLIITFLLEVYKENKRSLTCLLIFLASCLIGVFAQIKIPLFFTPVPLTIQTSAVMLVGAILGSKNGALAAFCYLIQGCMGLPVWAGGNSGITHFIGPTGGYLVAYVIQAYLVGWFFEKKYNTSLLTTFAILLFSTFLQLSIGTLWLAQFVGSKNCLLCGFYPFILGDSAKVLLLALGLSSFTNKK